MVKYTHAEKKWRKAETQMLKKAGVQFDIAGRNDGKYIMYSKCSSTKLLAVEGSKISLRVYDGFIRYRQLKAKRTRHVFPLRVQFVKKTSNKTFA